MCGICGVVAFEGERPTSARITAMNHALAHRGPDHQGHLVDGPVGLGHTRLSILDLSPASHQPFGDARFQLVFNGEVYNFQALRDELRALGHTFHTGADTEVILKAWHQWGRDALPRFDGMFALAMWDTQTQTLVAARDRFGIKPFYYQQDQHTLRFASEVKAILVDAGDAAREVDPAALHEYLYFGAALGGRSLFAGIQKLGPGEMLICDETGVRTEGYVSIYDLPDNRDDFPTAVARTRELVEQAVKAHLVSDVPVGVFLSGGIDSSTITAYAAKHYGRAIDTYAVGFDFEKGVNELAKAKRVADHFGTRHHELHIKGGDLPDVLETLVRRHDEPFGDPANIPLYLLCRELDGQIKVVLQGDGGDELFAGYRRYAVLSRLGLWRPAARLAGLALKAPVQGPLMQRLRRFAAVFGPADPAMTMALLMTVETLEKPPTRLLAPDFRAQIEDADAFARYRQSHAQFADLDPVQRMLFTDCQIILPEVFLEKVDKPTMSFGIEVRVPLLDNNLARYVMSLPARHKVHRNQKKYLLRQAMRGVVPDDILDAPKTGFGVPAGYWLREPLAPFLRGVLLDPDTLSSGWFDVDALTRAIDEHTSGARNHGHLLYKYLNLALWRRAYLRAAPALEPA